MTTYDRMRFGFLSVCFACSICVSADAFIFDDSFTPWLRTASGRRTANGEPGTLTWSIVPDGTTVTDGQSDLGGSDLLAFLNQNFDGDSNQADHTQQPWFSIFEESFQRWDELSGLTFQYEPNDDGLSISSRRRGISNRRGDIRISGASIDGGGGVLAFNFLPESGGDMTIDTDDLGFASSSGNFRFFRNTIMHELGHAFGLAHVSSDSDRLLMEPFTQTAFDGPQLDEIRAIQFFFGDALEEAHDGQGNNALDHATDLGGLRFGEAVVIGDDADRAGQRVSSQRTDYVSISNLNDFDFYSFSVKEFAKLSVDLTPQGGTFNQASEFGEPASFDADARSPLSLRVFDEGGRQLDETTLDLGESGSITSLSVEPGTYFTQVSGRNDTIQLYTMEIELATHQGDYNLDGIVDGADFTVWRDALGGPLSAEPAADGSGNGRIGQEDFEVWVSHFGMDYRSQTPLATSVPEPSGSSLSLIGVLGWIGVARWLRFRNARRVSSIASGEAKLISRLLQPK